MKTSVIAARGAVCRRRQSGALLVIVLVVVLLVGALLAGVTRQTANLRSELRRIEKRQIQHWSPHAPVPATNAVRQPAKSPAP